MDRVAKEKVVSDLTAVLMLSASCSLKRLRAIKKPSSSNLDTSLVHKENNSSPVFFDAQ